jgi:hypothetical protein
MANVAEIIDRIRANGANVIIDAGKLRIINSKKLPDGALDFIKRHGKEIAGFIEQEGEVEERAAIMEHDGGVPRAYADQLARLLQAHPPSDVPPADWTWFVGKAAQIVDRRAA